MHTVCILHEALVSKQMQILISIIYEIYSAVMSKLNGECKVKNPHFKISLKTISKFIVFNQFLHDT